jgi:hypothetical protein
VLGIFANLELVNHFVCGRINDAYRTLVTVGNVNPSWEELHAGVNTKLGELVNVDRTRRFGCRRRRRRWFGER